MHHLTEVLIFQTAGFLTLLAFKRNKSPPIHVE